jgi:hypothetical protein
MVNTTVAKVRIYSGLTTNQVADASVTQCITWADEFIAENYDNLQSNVKEIASTQLASHYAYQSVVGTLPDFELSNSEVGNPEGYSSTRFYKDFLRTVKPSKNYGLKVVND